MMTRMTAKMMWGEKSHPTLKCDGCGGDFPALALISDHDDWGDEDANALFMCGDCLRMAANLLEPPAFPWPTLSLHAEHAMTNPPKLLGWHVRDESGRTIGVVPKGDTEGLPR